MSNEVIFRLNASLEKREDRWALWCHELGFTVYGKTRKDAKGAFSDAVNTLVDSFAGDRDLLREHLDKKGVLHRFVTETPDPARREIEDSQDDGETFEQIFEAELAATA